MEASITSKIAFGERAGKMVRKIGSGFGFEQERPLVKGYLCSSVNGFKLHEAVHVAAENRDRLLQLIKYVKRPPLANEKLFQAKKGDLIYTLKTTWSDGTSALVTPLKFSSNTLWQGVVITLRNEKKSSA